MDPFRPLRSRNTHTVSSSYSLRQHVTLSWDQNLYFPSARAANAPAFPATKIQNRMTSCSSDIHPGREQETGGARALPALRARESVPEAKGLVSRTSHNRLSIRRHGEVENPAQPTEAWRKSVTDGKIKNAYDLRQNPAV